MSVSPVFLPSEHPYNLSCRIQSIGIQLDRSRTPSETEASPRPPKRVRFPPGPLETREERARLRVIKYESAFKSADRARAKFQEEVEELKMKFKESKERETNLQMRQERVRLRSVQYYAAFKASQCLCVSLQDEVKQLRKEADQKHIIWQTRLEAEKSASAAREASLQADINHLWGHINATTDRRAHWEAGAISIGVEGLPKTEEVNKTLRNVAQSSAFPAEHMNDPQHIRSALKTIEAGQRSR
ncbi:hypothetical protein F5879DRAFT_995636 [Lentinula edodes]|nr:hypothetical protein F5879DRAFT_995636 [Lentinula edodes]